MTFRSEGATAAQPALLKAINYILEPRRARLAAAVKDSGGTYTTNAWHLLLT